ncbi:MULTISPECIES: NADH-quinone oxidoreductase subunit G [unclassified Actinopolyspora]|uniref:NADH-quinone oxidoreductase subunit G n=1 Tax=unclassified Actinopolyspora TaxID=2639451 RepID=UPI0013F6009B|nr:MULTISPECIES: NADH-quinone oxidoreductase subunit G [unclassified Actinopolyspora]NHD16528.1 NADH-quinone oxidoreductase subunit G [Actinopolyspora sp. BKK2]NHE75609.1 NADH-quinone oxidoreductase subunit G [Actinopolyspora sp. BKK1]
MTVASASGNDTAENRPVPEGHVRLTIDGIEVDAPKGELVIRTAERLGIVVPRFCDHPLLDPAGACRQCLVEIEVNGKPMPKPAASCTMAVADGMVVHTQQTSAVADKAQQGVMELLLINHPLDCPICDKGGECPLQNQALKHGRADSRFVDKKRTFAKPVSISSQILLDRERCVLCQRCTRFSKQIAGDPFIEMLERGALQQIGTGEQQPFQSYFSGNTIQICPVGALTSAAYRFRSRPFDLVSTPGVCEHCSAGCSQRTDWRRGKVMRRLAGDDPEVNEEWNCDKGRFAFRYATAADRFTRPLVRDRRSGRLRETSWTEALRVAADGLLSARDSGGVGVLPGGRLTREDAYAYGKFARVALRTNDIDHRARPHSTEELDFLGAAVVGTGPEDGVTYAGIESAPTVLCVAFEPEEESPIVFLRLRKAARDKGTRVHHLGQWGSPGVEKTTEIADAGSPIHSGELLRCLPGEEAAVLSELPEEIERELSEPGSVLLLGERCAQVPGLYSAAMRVAERTGARPAWIPRRAGERGAVEAGTLPTLLPNGRPVSDSVVRADVERQWGMDEGGIPGLPGKELEGILAATESGELSGLLVGGVEPDDLPDPAQAERALRAADFVVSLELRPSGVTELADVVLPVAPTVEKSGTFLNWEGRAREFEVTIEGTGALPDCRVLDTLAVEMDVDLFTQTPAAVAGELARLGPNPGARPKPPDVPATRPGSPGEGRALLATWRHLLDNGSLQVEEPNLAGTARPPVARVSAGTARRLGLASGRTVRVSTAHGELTLESEVVEMPDEVVWLPGNSGSARLNRVLGAGHGSVVSIAVGPVPAPRSAPSGADEAAGAEIPAGTVEREGAVSAPASVRGPNGHGSEHGGLNGSGRNGTGRADTDGGDA